MKFEIERKGYSKVQVDEFIAALKSEYEQKLGEQKSRIFELKAELDETRKKLEGYAAREQLVSAALIKAVEKADEVEKLAAARYSEEMDALKSFHEKWKAHYAELLRRYPAEKSDAVSKFDEAMDEILSGGDGTIREIEARFEEESARLSKVTAAPPKSAAPARPQKPARKEPSAPVRSARQSLAEHETSESGFSFAEAWNPTDDLDSIMRDLGLGPEAQPKGKKKGKK